MSGASLGGMSGDLLITGAFEGDLTIDNTGGALPTPGDITIGDDYAGTIRIKDPSSVPYIGTILIDGDLSGQIRFDPDEGSSRQMAGVIEISGDVVVGGTTARRRPSSPPARRPLPTSRSRVCCDRGCLGRRAASPVLRQRASPCAVAVTERTLFQAKRG
jgi:hypothetical protein